MVGAGRRGAFGRMTACRVGRYCLAHAACPVVAVPRGAGPEGRGLRGWALRHRHLTWTGRACLLAARSCTARAAQVRRGLTGRLRQWLRLTGDCATDGARPGNAAFLLANAGRGGRTLPGRGTIAAGPTPGRTLCHSHKARNSRVRARRERLREQYLRPEASGRTAPCSGVHHLALICRDTEETIKFYQEFLGFPLVELVENRDYAGSNHFFFDIGNHNLLGFFDFPGHDHPRAGDHRRRCSTWRSRSRPSIRGGQEEAGPGRASTTSARTAAPMDSMYFRDPNGVGLELYREELGIFNGRAAPGLLAGLRA